jgi:hypothetical protein
MIFPLPPKENNNDTSSPSQAPLHSMTKLRLHLYSPQPPTLCILDPINNVMMEYFGHQIINCKVTNITTSRASICRLALHAGIFKRPDKSLRIGRYSSKTKGLSTYKRLQVRRVRRAAKHALEKSLYFQHKERCNKQLINQMGRGHKLPSSQEEGANRDGGQNSGGGPRRQGGNKVKLGNFCCALFSHQPPSSYLLDNGTDGGGKRVLYRHPSLELECARGDGGCNGGGHIATEKGEERVACN